MARYIIIAVTNLLVVLAIAASAAWALVRGCNMDGSCAGPSSALTWGLATGMSALFLIGSAILARVVANKRGGVPNQDIAIAAAPRVSTEAAAQPEPGPADESLPMLSLLARIDRPRPTIVDEACGVQREPTAPALQLVVDNAARREASQPALDRGTASEKTLDWLLDPARMGKAIRLREDTSFPWCFAGIDATARAFARCEAQLMDTDIPAEAAAWCSIARSSPAGTPLNAADAAAFTGWTNAALRLLGRNGLLIVDDAVRALTEAGLADPSIALALPPRLADAPLRQPRYAQM